jgi:hypothetical protein
VAPPTARPFHSAHLSSNLEAHTLDLQRPCHSAPAVSSEAHTPDLQHFLETHTLDLAAQACSARGTGSAAPLELNELAPTWH